MTLAEKAATWAVEGVVGVARLQGIEANFIVVAFAEGRFAAVGDVPEENFRAWVVDLVERMTPEELAEARELIVQEPAH